MKPFFYFRICSLIFFTLEPYLEYNEYYLYRMKHEQSLSSFFHYFEIFKVKHREKMFSRYLLFAYYLLDFSPIKWSISNLCKTITFYITKNCSSWTGVVLQNTFGGLLLMMLLGKTFFMFLNHYTEWYVLKAVPQRNSTARVPCKYAVSLL